MNHIERILEVTHVPNAQDLASIQSPYASTMLESIPQGAIQFKVLGEVFPNASSDAIDIIRICFCFNPSLRPPTSEDLLRHQNVAEFHSEEDEPVYYINILLHLYYFTCILYFIYLS